MMRMTSVSAWTLSLALGISAAVAPGCGGGGGSTGGATTAGVGEGGAGGGTAGEDGGPKIDPEAADAFKGATRSFKQHDDARDWDDASCKKVADQFLAAGKAQSGKFAAAHYNAGVTYMKCDNQAAADAEFEIALGQARDQAMASSDPKVKADPEFHQVWVQRAILRYRKGDVSGISEAIDTIMTKGFDPDGSKNVEAFVQLGMLYRERWNKDSGNAIVHKKDDFGLEDDLARSQFWLQNALAINDAYMPAYNQLALYYLDKARAVAAKAKSKGTGKDDKKVKSDLQTLDLGLLVAEEASRRDEKYPAIWNTKGLILLEMGRTGDATKAFKKATDNDPKFFEAWMNYAAINLAFRGYEAAAEGYKAAMGINPQSYEAKLGYAVAVRGQLDFHLTAKQKIERLMNECTDPAKSGSGGCQEAATQGPAQVKEHDAKFHDFFKGALDAYDAAIALDKDRPEAYFDRALLIEKYKQKATGSSTQESYEEAQKLYEEIATKFAGNPKYEKLVTDAKGRGEEARKAAEFEKNAAAGAAAAAAAAAAPPPAPSTSAAPAASTGAAPASSAAPK